MSDDRWPAGWYESYEHIRWADGTSSERSGPYEYLTADEATARKRALATPGVNVDPTVPPGSGVLRLPGASSVRAGEGVSAEQVGPNAHLIGFDDDRHPMVSWLIHTLLVIRMNAEDALAEWPDGTDGDEAAGLPDHILVGAHLLRNQPKALLARVDAERSIVDHHEAARREVNTPSEWEDAPDGPDDFGCCSPDDLCPTLRLLAYGHRFDAEGYDPAWAPEG